MSCVKGTQHTARVDDHEYDGKAHGGKHYSETGRHSNKLNEFEGIFAFYNVEDGHCGENPPGITVGVGYHSYYVITKMDRKQFTGTVAPWAWSSYRWYFGF